MQRVLQRGGSRGLGRAALARLSSGGGAPPEAGAGTSAGAAKPARMVPPQPAPRDFEEETLREVQEKIDAKAKLDSTPAADDETGGPRGEEPTRFGDWERKGRVTDF